MSDIRRSRRNTQKDQQAAERAIEQALQRMADRLGDDRFERFAMTYLLTRESDMRARHPPDHPALQLIDEWRREGKVD